MCFSRFQIRYSSAKDCGISFKSQYKSTDRCIYIYPILGSNVHKDNTVGLPLFESFSLLPQRRHLSSIIFDIWDDVLSLLIGRGFCLIIDNDIMRRAYQQPDLRVIVSNIYTLSGCLSSPSPQVGQTHLHSYGGRHGLSVSAHLVLLLCYEADGGLNPLIP